MKTMSSKEIKDHYGLFAETARREPVVHTSHGREVLVTISIERARAIPELSAELGASASGKKHNPLLAALGKGEHLTAAYANEDPAAALRKARDEWR